MIEKTTNEKNVTISQLAITWVLAQSNDIMALVGSRTVGQLHDTVKAIDINLSNKDLQRRAGSTERVHLQFCHVTH